LVRAGESPLVPTNVHPLTGFARRRVKKRSVAALAVLAFQTCTPYGEWDLKGLFSVSLLSPGELMDSDNRGSVREFLEWAAAQGTRGSAPADTEAMGCFGATPRR